MFEELKLQIRQSIGNKTVKDINDDVANKLRKIAAQSEYESDFKKVIACYEMIVEDMGIDTLQDTARTMLLHRYSECGYAKNEFALKIALKCLNDVDEYNKNNGTDIIMPDVQMSALEVLAANDFNKYWQKIINIAESNFYVSLRNYKHNPNFPNAALTLDFACRILMKSYIKRGMYQKAVDLFYVDMPEELCNNVHRSYVTVLQIYMLDPKGVKTITDAEKLICDLKEYGDLPENYWILGIMSAEGYCMSKSIENAKAYFKQAKQAIEKYRGTIGYSDFEFSVFSNISEEEIIKLAELGKYHSKFYKKQDRNVSSGSVSSKTNAESTSSSYINNSESSALEISSGGCYVATCVYGSYDCPSVWTLRRFRDSVLSKNPFGRLFIRFYYSVSPTAVKLFGSKRWFHKLFKRPLDYIVEKLNNCGVENTPYRDK